MSFSLHHDVHLVECGPKRAEREQENTQRNKSFILQAPKRTSRWRGKKRKRKRSA